MSAKSLDDRGREQAIRRVLRRRGSLDYFKHGGWTSDPAEADSFSDVVEVAEICARYHLSDVELAVRYDHAACDLFCTSIR